MHLSPKCHPLSRSTCSKRSRQWPFLSVSGVETSSQMRWSRKRCLVRTSTVHYKTFSSLRGPFAHHGTGAICDSRGRQLGHHHSCPEKPDIHPGDVPPWTVSDARQSCQTQVSQRRISFNVWIAKCNGKKLKDLTTIEKYETITICDNHFESTYKIFGTKRLHKYAAPTLLLPTSKFCMYTFMLIICSYLICLCIGPDYRGPQNSIKWGSPQKSTIVKNTIVYDLHYATFF